MLVRVSCRRIEFLLILATAGGQRCRRISRPNLPSQNNKPLNSLIQLSVGRSKALS